MLSIEDRTALSEATTFQLALAGLGFGLLHVLSGPDHLTALATLSAGSSWRSFALGLRWGCGHSIGLIIMATIFIALDGHFDFSMLNVVTDVLVGVFMIALGVYGVFESVQKWKPRQSKGDQTDKTSSDYEDDGEASTSEMETEMDTELIASPQRTLLMKTGINSSDQGIITLSDDALAVVKSLRLETDMESSKTGPDEEITGIEYRDVGSQLRERSSSMETISLKISPCESGELLGQSSDKMGTDRIESMHENGYKCCGISIPPIDLQNAQTQKVVVS
ncbi:hypothetical protein CCR75_006612 [Bremia lactucae]|uniref:Nickel/cobalt efflux system n=1 Tax=Bremia lactucae TaxID=4779 RepID=A0A976ICI6_BRELC|nr:hypothetical protein CCR75_006612 [Bremia lactucae]